METRKWVTFFLFSIFASIYVVVRIIASSQGDLLGLWASQVLYSPFMLVLLIVSVIGLVKNLKETELVKTLARASVFTALVATILPVLFAVLLGLNG